MGNARCYARGPVQVESLFCKCDAAAKVPVSVVFAVARLKIKGVRPFATLAAGSTA
jgi:hypothetical protein